MPPIPTIPGFTLIAGPFASTFGTPGYLVYEGASEPANLAVPDGYEWWMKGPNTAGRFVLIIRPTKAPPTPPPPPPGPTDGVLIPSGGDVSAALKAAQPGGKVYLQAGGTYPAITEMVTRATGLTLAAWGTGPRPIIRSLGTSGLTLWATDNFTVDGIAFIGANPAKDSAGINVNGCRNLKITRCEVTLHRMGITLESAGERKCVGVVIDGNYIHDNAPGQAGGDSSGLFAGGVDGLAVTNNVFDHNGWSDSFAGTIRNHNFYCRGDCGPATITNNVFAHASSHGLQARAGGNVTNNLFIDNPVHMSYGLVNGGGPIHIGGVSGKVTGNTFVGTRKLAGGDRGWALEISNALDVEVSGNTFASDVPYDQRSGGMAAAIKLDKCNLDPSYPDRDKAIGIKRIVLDGNRINWTFGRLWVNPALHMSVTETHPANADVAAVRADAAAKIAAAIRGMVK